MIRYFRSFCTIKNHSKRKYMIFFQGIAFLKQSFLVEPLMQEVKLLVSENQEFENKDLFLIIAVFAISASQISDSK